MNISAWSIRRPIPAIVLFIILTIAGLFSFHDLSVDESPNIDVPIVTVDVSEAGAAPAELEVQVTRKVEDAIAGIGNIKHITSRVVEGSSDTVIEFELGTDADRATNDVRDAVSRIRQQLPPQINDPVVERQSFTGGALATYTVSDPRLSIAQLSWLIDNDISRALLAIPGVAQVEREGGVDREIRIGLDPSRLEAVGLTVDQVSSQIRALNVNLPGGRGDVGGEEQAIRTLGSAATLEQLRAARISLPVSFTSGSRAAGGWARLDTLGRITDGSAEPRHRALLDGNPVVAFSIVRSTGSNLVDVANAVDRKLDALRKTLPRGVRVDKIRTDARYVMMSYNASFDSLIVGAALAVLVIWLFLMEWRAAVISALAMPLSVIPTFAVMQWMGYTLNNMSLLGLALVIGILVDDAIVEIENIVRHIHMGKDPFHAALDAADEIGLAVVATTMSIIVVFVPVAFMGGIPGQFMKQFGMTVAVAVFFSLVVARLVTPMMAAYWMRVPKHDGGRGHMVAIYDGMLSWSLRHRFVTLAAAVLFFAFSIKLFAAMPQSLVSQSDRGETMVNVEMPPGTDIDSTTAAARQVTAILHRHGEVKSVFAQVGTGGLVNKSTLFVTLTPRGTRHLTQQQVEDAVRPDLRAVPGARITLGSTGGFAGKLSVVLTSDHPQDLQRGADALIHQMRAVPGLADVTSSASLLRPEIQIVPDRARAAEQGVSVESIARTAMVATLGDVDQNLAKFDLPDRQINIRVQLDPSWRDDLQRIGSLRVASASGALVPLKNVARVEVGNGPTQIDRYDRSRQISINATLLNNLPLGEAVNRVHALPAFVHLPATVKEEPAGDAEIQRDVFAGFSRAMGAGVVGIYAVLVLLFGAFTQPLTIMVALPLSIGGALMGLILAHQALGFYALIGIVMLMGLSTKNSILLVEYCIMSMHRGRSRDEAITSAGEARMRPILMTTVAMIAGMLPIAFGIGAGSEVRMAMAIAVIGGLITSTFLTLLVVPVIFSMVDDATCFAVRLVRRPAPMAEPVSPG